MIPYPLFDSGVTEQSICMCTPGALSRDHHLAHDRGKHEAYSRAHGRAENRAHDRACHQGLRHINSPTGKGTHSPMLVFARLITHSVGDLIYQTPSACFRYSNSPWSAAASNASSMSSDSSLGVIECFDSSALGALDTSVLCSPSLSVSRLRTASVAGMASTTAATCSGLSIFAQHGDVLLSGQSVEERSQ